MAELICFKCRRRLPSGVAVCPACGIVPALGAEREWALLELEKSFVLIQAHQMSDWRVPRFMGIPEWWLVRLAAQDPDIETLQDSNGEDPGWEVADLNRMVREGDGTTRASAAHRLALLGEAGTETLLALIGALRNSEAPVRRIIYWSLSRLGGPDMLRPMLLRLYHEKDAECWTWLRLVLLRSCLRLPPRTMSDTDLPRSEFEELVASHLRRDLGTDTQALMRRSMMHRNTGHLLKAVGDATRAWTASQQTLGEALLQRSRLFLLLGMPIASVDDYLSAPRKAGRLEAAFEQHREGLVDVCREFEAAASKEASLKGLAKLFAVRLRLLESL